MRCGTPVSHSFERSRWVVTAAQGSAGHGLRSAVAPRRRAAPPRPAAAGPSKRIGKTCSHGAPGALEDPRQEQACYDPQSRALRAKTIGYARVSTVDQDPEYQIRQLRKRGCQLVSLTENLDADSPGGKLVFLVFAALAQFETYVNDERTKESPKAAKAAGHRWGRKSIFHDPSTVRVG